jgi:hypothetical protein
MTLNGLSSIFHRPLTAIHNTTHGLPFDLIHAVTNLALPLTSPASAHLYETTRDALLQTAHRKVIILSHSTGSLILSQVLDRLHADLPIDALGKLEIYTFGAGASHLSNPCLALDSPFDIDRNGHFTRSDGSIVTPSKALLAGRGVRVGDMERVLPHVEHYACEGDWIARWGVLHHVRNVLDNRFSGRVIVMQQNDRAGYGMNEGYLDMLFPGLLQGQAERVGIMDCAVDVDFETAEKREFTAQGVAAPAKAVRTSGASSPDRGAKNKSEKRSSWGSMGGYGIDAVAQARGSAKECEGKTVRQLSRLWRYVGGGRPVGEGVSLVNGVGNGAM